MLEIVKIINELLWSFLLLIVLLGTGIFFTIKLKFIQIVKFKEACKVVFGHFKSDKKIKKEGEMTPFQSLATAHEPVVSQFNLLNEFYFFSGSLSLNQFPNGAQHFRHIEINGLQLHLAAFDF